MHAAKDTLKAFAGNDFGKEAGAVMVINAFNAGLNLFAAEGGGVYGKIAALGVAANTEPAAEGIRSRAEILHRFLLCGHNGEEAHVEIFLPPHERPIRTTKRHIGEFAFKENGKCGKLLFRRRIEQVHIA